MSNEYPEHEKLKEVAEESQIIGGFLEWLTSERTPTIWLCQTHEKHGDVYIPQHKSIEKWLAEYFGIDLARIEAEKREMLEELRREKP